MKKLVLVAAAFLVIAGMTSCKKNYTCTCTYGASSGLPSTSSTIDDTKSKATTACSALSTDAALLGGSCSIN